MTVFFHIVLAYELYTVFTVDTYISINKHMWQSILGGT